VLKTPSGGEQTTVPLIESEEVIKSGATNLIFRQPAFAFTRRICTIFEKRQRIESLTHRVSLS
jgi:hypothetical protein